MHFSTIGGYKMEAIQELILKYDWNLLCWEDRYSRGIWAIVAPDPNHTYEIREITDGEGILSTALSFISVMKVHGSLFLMEVI